MCAHACSLLLCVCDLQALALLHNGRLTGCLDRRTVTVDAAEGRVVVCAVEMPASSSSAPEAEVRMRRRGGPCLVPTRRAYTFRRL